MAESEEGSGPCTKDRQYGGVFEENQSSSGRRSVFSQASEDEGGVTREEPVARLSDSQTGSTEEAGEQDVWCPYLL